MKRFWYAFGLAIAGGIFVSTALVIGVFVLDNTNQIRQLDPEFIDLFAEAIQTGALQDPERSAALQQVTIEYLEGADGFDEIVRVVQRALEPRTRLLLLTALVALPIGLLTALVIGNYVSRPVVAVSDAARRVAAGDLSARAQVKGGLSQRGEAGELVRDFNKMAAALESLEQERQNMITDVAHELRTPLTIIQGQVDAIQYGVVPLDRSEVTKLSRHIELLSRLIKDLRVLSQADSRRLTLSVAEVDLQSLAADIVDGFQDQAVAGGITLQLESRLPEPLVVEIDGDRIAQILINLLGNALRHAPAGGQVTVTLEGSGAAAQLSVRDSGEGLKEEELERVFQRFYRTDASRNRSSGGTGLGLAISRAIAELHGGSLTASNREGAGTEFRLELPRRQQS